jgi:hypothetical protein
MSPGLIFTISKNKISDETGYDSLTVAFSSDIAYSDFECRATLINDNYGLGIGDLIATFSNTPANTERTFEIYDTNLVHGEGEYRISLYAKSVESGSWNDNHSFITSGVSPLVTNDNKNFLCVR